MGLGLGPIVSLVVLGVVAMVGAVGYLIEKSVERHERHPLPPPPL